MNSIDYVQTYLKMLALPNWVPNLEIAPKPMGHRTTNFPAGHDFMSRLFADNIDQYWLMNHGTVTASRALLLCVT